MNNIYKVIWSKAKNCYVVASEIAKSHTKSASGSEKMGGYGKKALLALAAASAIFCGGLVNVGATVRVNGVTDGANEVYTTTEVNTELGKKANADSVYTKSETYTKDEVNTELGEKANADSVYTKGETYTKDEVNTELGKKANADSVYTKGETYSKDEVNTELGKKANADSVYTKGETYTKDEVNTELGKKADANNVYTKTVADGKFATSAALNTAKTDLEGEITTAKNELDGKIAANTTKITDLQTTTAGQADAIKDLKDRTTNISYDSGKQSTSINGIEIGDTQVDMNGKNLTDVGTINGIDLGTKLKGNYISQDGSIWGNMMQVDDQVKTNADAIAQEVTNRETAVTNAKTELEKKIQTNANNIKSNKDEIARVNGELVNTNDYFNKELGKTNDYFNSELSKTNNHFNTELGKTNAALQATNKRTAGIGRTDTGVEADNQTVIEGKVHFDQNGNVSGVKDLKTDTIHATGEINTTGKVSAGDVSTGTLETTGDATIGGDLTVKGELKTDKIAMEHTGTDADGTRYNSSTTITADGITHIGEVEKSGVITKSQFTHTEEGSETYATKGDKTDWTETRSDVKADGVKTEVKDSKGNRTNTSQTTEVINGFAIDEDGNSSTTSQTAKDINGNVTDKDGNKTDMKVTATENSIQIQDKDGKNTNLQVNKMGSSVTEIKNAAGATTKTEQTATDITNTAKDGTITNDANHIVNKANTMDTNVTGKATESYGSLDTTVNGNETHIVKGTKTETVEGKVTENYKAGQATNVTGDQVITVSGTQTTKATDINRNASSGMIDTIDNDYGTNTETKVAGKTTTDVSIKGTGEKGQYIRGANESRDYLIKGTLKNSETKTVDATSTEITDGNGNTSATIQDVNNLAGSVTNGTETGVSGIHAKDNSVSIDSIVTDGNKHSVINQKKGSIQSTVVDGTNSTVILQDKDNVTIASSNGMVGLVGKDIVNNAQNTITNTAGTSITNQVKDSKVTTDANGTTFENNTPAVSDGGATTTKINGNHINTGRVDANELGVSDKDDQGNTADFSVKAGEGVKASASNGTTTGSLDVKADEVSSSVKDADGKGSTFKQRIDAIMMESKNVSIKAEETLTNEAKVITNKASEVINNEAININNTATGIITSKASEIKNQADKLISNKVGENTWENMEDGKITTSIKNGTKQNLTQSDAEKTEHSVVNGSNSTVNKQTSEEITDAVTNGTTTNVTQNTATSSNNTIADKNGNANTVISTADGTSFINSKAAAPVTGASGAGTHLNTTIKGNTITTGRVTMDYADVMKDLGVHGSAKVDNNLEVGGTTTTKTLKVTENAEIGGNATITGDVTARSYKVGDKTYISAAGINANNQKITDVADGSISEGSKDAVNGGQLYTVKNDLEGKVNKVGANAAAMANLHPMEFDPDSKWNIAAAIGNYGSETAAALGAFYRPNDDVMVNLSTAFGTGENMVGGGVSVRLGKSGNKLSREENNALKAQVDDLTARMDALLSVLNPNMSKDFPDVPENHWAYEAVSRLAGNDIVQGYPDGEFHGERTMTRYEMAEIIYNALSRGAEAERELVEEFKPELQAMAASEKATAEKAEG